MLKFLYFQSFGKSLCRLVEVVAGAFVGKEACQALLDFVDAAYQTATLGIITVTVTITIFAVITVEHFVDVIDGLFWHLTALFFLLGSIVAVVIVVIIVFEQVFIVF